MLETTPGTPTTDELHARLRCVIDPEIGINIVDLGLVYDVRVDDAAITVTLTMTTPACPLGPYLEEAVESALGEVAGARFVAVRVTFEPPWSSEAITPEGRELLGWAL
ncbi:MAG: metal-sulfur cluster assembly factor [Nitriliruptor sp.]|uniref:metal-sulfur cluster assembly factor n=1 Tax=Nitriliruptor sp. TaxID=2448056 RepID=UPI0034A01D12